MVLVAFVHLPALHAEMSQSAVDEAMSRGYAAIKAQDREGAKAAFLSVVTDALVSPKVPEAMTRLGHLQLPKEPDDALQTFTSLVEKYPDSPYAVTAYYRLGALNTRQQYYDDAQAAFKAASQHKTASQVNKGRARLEAAFVEVMKFYANEYWGRDENGHHQLLKPDTAEAKVKRLEDARKQFEAIRDDFAKSEHREIAAIADCAIGEIYLLGKIPHLAEKAYWRAIRQYGTMPGPLNALARYGIGQAKYSGGDPEGAVEQFDLAVSGFAAGDVCGISVAPLRMKGNAGLWKVVALESMDRVEDALAAVNQLGDQLEARDPAMAAVAPSILLWKGSLLSRTGSVEPAMRALQRVIDEYPISSEAKTASLIMSDIQRGGE